MGTLENYGDVWYHEEALTNILSLQNLHQKGYGIQYNNEDKDVFLVTKPNGKKVQFNPSNDGLYFYDTRSHGVNLLNSVEDNKSKYSARQIKRADKARATYYMIGLPSVRDYKNLIRFSLIKNCPVTIKDIKIAEDIYGPSISALKGKTRRQRPDPVINDTIAIPEQLKNLHRDVTIGADIIHINKQPFLATVSHEIEFVTTEHLQDLSKKTIGAALKSMCKLYKNTSLM